MAGHSKSSKVKHIKGPLDAKRGAAVSKRVKETTVAACIGGGDPSGNPRRHPVVGTAREDTQNVYSNFEMTEDVLAWLPA